MEKLADKLKPQNTCKYLDYMLGKEGGMTLAVRYYLGVDQGTTGTTALLLDENLAVRGRGYRELRQYYPRPGWVEHDPVEIWKSVLDAARQAMEQAGARADEISCVGLDHQGETCLIWDKKTGKPVYPAIVWQDRRTAEDADRLAQEHGAMIRERTGLMADAYFSATKLGWLLENVPDLRRKSVDSEVLAGTLDSWLLWNMTGGRAHCTDPSTASRTMLFHLEQGCWDGEMLGLMNIPLNILPEIRESAGYFGTTDPETFLGISAPITAMLVDQQAALFGQRCYYPGQAKATYGTGCFLLMNTGDTPVRIPTQLLTTVAWRLGGKTTYALDGGVYIAGAAIQWLRDGLELIRSPGETELLAEQAETNGGMYFVPAFAGLAAPHWDQYARGTIVGLTAGVTKAQFVRATLESVAYQVKDNLDAMEAASGIAIPSIRADGGMAKNRFLMQFQADILGVPVEVPQVVDTTALGAALCAALGHGVFSNLSELCGRPMEQRCYEPTMSEDQRQYWMHQWHRAVERSLHWEEHGKGFK